MKEQPKLSTVSCAEEMCMKQVKSVQMDLETTVIFRSPQLVRIACQACDAPRAVEMNARLLGWLQTNLPRTYSIEDTGIAWSLHVQ